MSISCRNFSIKRMRARKPAVDLATAGERLKWDWFRRYLLDPQSLRPGTRMPAFWPNGVAANHDILDGDPEKQIFAIWAYLARKNFTDLPNGLVQGKQEIVADKEAVIYRNFIAGAGSRAIGVGYPAHIVRVESEPRFRRERYAPRADLAGGIYRCRPASHRPRGRL